MQFFNVKLAEIIADILVLGTLAVCDPVELDRIVVSHDLSVEVSDTHQCFHRLLFPIYRIGYGNRIEVFFFIDEIVDLLQFLFDFGPGNRNLSRKLFI